MMPSPGRASWLGIALAMALLVAQTQANTLPSAARAEIGALLSTLATSGCRFNRNGSWYSASDARTHLQRKFDYLAGKDAIASAEQFIERAATQSSTTGRPYWVQCGGQAAEPSRVWLASQLRAMRTQLAVPK